MDEPPKVVRSINIPVNGPLDHNVGPQVAIGGLVIAWANNESVFMAMIQCLVGGGEETATIVWYSHPSTRARLELLDRLIRERLKDVALIADIQRAIKNYKGQTRVRNFFCHATYNYDLERRLASVHGTEVTQDGEPLKNVTKPMGPATLNEITSATMELNRLNLTLWELVVRLQNALGVQRLTLPPLLLENLRAVGRPDPIGAQTPP